MKRKKTRLNLSVARAKLDLTKKEVASKIGIHESTYSSIENGTRNPSLTSAKKIAEFYKIKIEEI